MNPLACFFLWLVVGGGASYAHLYRLRTLVSRSAGMPFERAQKSLTRFAPLRILAFVPVLLGAAYCGLAGCTGVVLGILVGRLVGITSGQLRR